MMVRQSLSDTEINRELAVRSVDRLEAALERATRESSALARWLLGALIAMHGVGLMFIGVFPGGLAGDTVRQGLAAFALGALLAFLGALVSGIATFFIARMIRMATGEWMDVIANGTDSAAAVDAARRLRRFANLWRAVAILAGLVSLLLLLAGGATVAQDMASEPPHALSVVPPPPEATGNESAAGNLSSINDAVPSVVTEVEPAQSALPAATAQPDSARTVPVPVPVPASTPQKTEPKPAAVKPQPQTQPKPQPQSRAEPQPARPATTTPTPPQLPVVVPQTDPGSSGGGR